MEDTEQLIESMCFLQVKASVSSGQLVLLVHDGLMEAHFGIFKVWLELQSLFKVAFGIVKKPCKMMKTGE